MKTYQITRAVGRLIGDDHLMVHQRQGLLFMHKKHAVWGETVFEADLKTCRTIAAMFGDCKVVDAEGREVK